MSPVLIPSSVEIPAPRSADQLMESFMVFPKNAKDLNKIDFIAKFISTHIISYGELKILTRVGIILKDFPESDDFRCTRSLPELHQRADIHWTHFKPFLGTTDFDIEDFLILVKTSSSMPEVFLKLSGVLSDLINFYSNELIPISKIISLTLCELTKNSNQQVRSRSRQILIIWFNRNGFKYRQFHRFFWMYQEP